MTAEQLANLFHETYETLAPEYGYETRPETKEFKPESPNGKLMIAVCEEVLTLLASRDAEIAELVAALERMRVAGGSQEFHIAWELAKDVLDKVRKP